MKHFFTFLGIAGILVVALTATNVMAQSSQPAQTLMPPAATLVPMQQGQYPQIAQAPAQQSWGMGMRGGGGMMGGGRMGGGRMAAGGSTQTYAGAGMTQGQMTGTTGGYGMNNGSMMYGVTPMYDDVASYMGMTAQDLYNQMAAGNSMVQIAAQKGITEQHLMDAIMTGRYAAYGQAIKGGYMTQAQANTMYQNMNNNLKNMVNGQGYGSSGWSMMWDTQTTPQTAP